MGNAVKVVAILGWGFSVGRNAGALELIRVVAPKPLSASDERDMVAGSERLAAAFAPDRKSLVAYAPANGFVPAGWDVAGRSYSADGGKLFIKYTKEIK